MSSKFSKKNADYSQNERKITAFISFLLFSLLAFYYTKSFLIDSESLELILPYLMGLITGTLISLFSYRYPKIIHLTVFALPLMFAGS